jgi:hypothetical protein
MQIRDVERIIKRTPRRERGSVLVIALIMIVLLTIIGISASKTSEIEIMIAGNERIAKENLYLAEAAVRRAAQVMHNSDLNDNPPAWLYKEIDRDDDSKTEYEDMATGALVIPASKQDHHAGNYGFLDVEGLIHEDENWTDVYSYQFPGMGTDTRCIAIRKDLSPNTSPKATDPMSWDFALYGRSQHKNGFGLLVVGFRKAY